MKCAKKTVQNDRARAHPFYAGNFKGDVDCNLPLVLLSEGFKTTMARVEVSMDDFCPNYDNKSTFIQT